MQRLRSDLDAVSEDALVGGNAAINLDVLEASSSRPAGHRADDPAGHLRRPRAPAPLGRRPAAARRGERRVVRGDDRHLRAGLPARVRLPEQRPVDRALRVRLPRGARHRLLHLPHDPGARGGEGTRHQPRHPHRAGGDRWGHHQRGHRAGGDLLGAAVLPIVFLVQIAFIVAFGVLLDTFVVRSLLVPAAAYDVGAPIWWPRHLAADTLGNGGGRARRSTPRSPRSPSRDARRAGRLRVRRARHPRTRPPRGRLLRRGGVDGQPRAGRCGAGRPAGRPGRSRARRAARRPGPRPRGARDTRAAGMPPRCGRSSTPVWPASSTSRSPWMRSPQPTVVRHAADAGVPLTVFQNRRYDAEQATVARVVADGLVGTAFRYEMRWERWRPVPKDRWRENATPAEGGGILLDLHSHLVDAAVQLFGPVATVFATVEATDDPCRGRRLPRLPPRRWGGLAPRGHLAVAVRPGPRVRLLGHRGGVRAGRLPRARPTCGPDRPTPTTSTAVGCTGVRSASPCERAESGQADLYRAVVAALACRGPARRRCRSTRGTPCTRSP